MDLRRHYYTFSTITTAQTSQPSLLPTKPRRSVVVALTLMAPAGTPHTEARHSRMAGT